MLKVYVAGGKINGWIITSPVKESDLAMEAANSFVKAGQVDAKLAAKVNEGLEKVKNYYSTAGTVAYKIGEAGKAAEAYMAADKVQNMSGFTGQKSGDFIYNAGLTYVMDGEKNPASFVKGAEALTKALESGYADEQGNIYYYLFHAYYGQKDSSVRVANLQRAKTVLMEGLAKFPANTLIVEGLIGLYTDRENPVGDPQELVSMVDGALERDPSNKSLWNSRAIMFDRMKNYPESIKSFQKVVELGPQNVQATYNLALSYIFQGDAMNDEMNSRDYKSNADFQADQKKVIEAYKPAVPVLEAAHKLDPKHLGVLETLKSLTFRLRDEEGMMAKYEQYNKALNELKAQ
jgi:tetratricopeptide (TPR) repeat protein